jgi:hypothetical protein
MKVARDIAQAKMNRARTQWATNARLGGIDDEDIAFATQGAEICVSQIPVAKAAGRGFR